jgi:ABC-type phosphate transport system permease subunit
MEWETIPPPAASTETRWVASHIARRSKRFDSIFAGIAFLSGWGTVALLVLIGLEVGYAALPAIRQYGFGPMIQDALQPKSSLRPAFSGRRFFFGVAA